MLEILQPFFMVLLLIILGIILFRFRLLEADFCKSLSQLTLRVAMPALLFSSMYKNIDLDSFRQGWVFPLLGLASAVFLTFPAHFSGGRLGLAGKTLGTYQILSSNGNNVFLPVPIVLALYGPAYVVYPFLFELGAGFFYWSYGLSRFQQGAPLLKRIFNPNIAALLLGLGAGLLQIRIPVFVLGALETVGNLTIGAALLIIGGFLADLLHRKVRWRRELLGIILHRFLLSPLLALVFFALVRLRQDLGTILLLLLAMPSVASAVLVASSHEADEDLATQAVVITTLASLVVCPLILLLRS